MIDVAGLKKNVNFLNWAVGIIFLSGLGAIIISFLTLSSKIDSRFDRIDDRAQRFEQQANDLRVSVTEQRADTKAILEKVSDDQSQRGERQRPPR